MKRTLLLLITFLMTGPVVSAQILNNPKDTAGYYIVKWDCDLNGFAASNDMEFNETFTFAIDVTGTPFTDWLKETPAVEGATRALAINKWTNYGDVSGGTNRLKQIGENIFAATWNIHQMATTMDVIAATGNDSVVDIYGQVFGFEFTADNPGAGWWLWPEGMAEATVIDPGTGAIFRTLPYTGTKGSPILWSDDYEGGLFFSNNIPEQGYTLPCMVPVSAAGKAIPSDARVVGHEYYNILGVLLHEEPRKGFYIHRILKEDGSSELKKEFRFSEY